MTMKKSILIASCTAILISLALSLYAQEKPMRYLFDSNGAFSVTGFGGPLVGFSEILGDFAVTSGGGGAALFNQKFFIGGYGEGLATEHFIRNLEVYSPSSQKNIEYDKMQLTFGHGGLWVGYIHDHYKLLHWGISARAGAGGIGLNYPGFMSGRHDIFMNDVVFVFTPQIEMEINLFPWMKMNVGAGYRLVSGVNRTYRFMQENGTLTTRSYFESGDFSSPNFTLGLLFGGFSRKNGNGK